MSVQAGIWNVDGKPVEEEDLTRIGQPVAEFGPDGEMTHLDGPLGMLYRPFHTTPESRLECQPYLCNRGMVITWDGRLDNRDELIMQLGGTPADASDVTIVAAAFQRWSIDCFAKLVGDWALALWDSRQQELVLARDYIGVKRLYYYKREKSVVWCTHLKPLALCGDQFNLCEEYIAGFLGFHPRADLTPYQGVLGVPPGSAVRVRNGACTLHKYWGFSHKVTNRYKSDAEYEQEFLHLFRQAVRRRLRADRSILAELSGGFDSSSIVRVADDILTKDACGVSPVYTLSYYDSKESETEDLAQFSIIEKTRQTTGLHIDLAGNGDSLRFEWPSFSAVPGFGIRTEAKAALSGIVQEGKYRVMLCGAGGDELNGQALDLCIPLAQLMAHLRLKELGKELVQWSLVTRRPLLRLLLDSVRQLPLVTLVGTSGARRFGSWVNRGLVSKYSATVWKSSVSDRVFFVSPRSRDSVESIEGLTRFISHTSESVLERRYPFLDQSLLIFLASVPFEQLVRRGERRSLMRRALTGILPQELVDRKTKAAGATRAYCATLQRHWEEVSDIVTSTMSSQLGYLDSLRFREALIGVKYGHVPADISRLLKALSLELWLRDVIARGVVATIRPPKSKADARVPETLGHDCC